MKRYELARLHLVAAQEDHEDGVEEWEVWENLFKWAALNYSPPRTNRQKEVQRLWQQRGLLERTKANLQESRKLINATEFHEESWKIEEASRVVNAMIGRNMDEVATVKERIPKCPT